MVTGIECPIAEVRGGQGRNPTHPPIQRIPPSQDHSDRCAVVGTGTIVVSGEQPTVCTNRRDGYTIANLTGGVSGKL